MKIKSDTIIHSNNYICCNICQHEEIYNDNTTGVCIMIILLEFALCVLITEL
jgi:hypothetical protein